MGIFDFNPLKKSIQSATTRYNELRSEREKVQSRRNAIASAPACRADIKVMISDWSEKTSEQFRADMRSGLAPFIRNPYAAKAHGSVGPAFSVAGVSVPAGNGPDLRTLDSMVCALLGQSLVDTLHRLIDAMDWPANEGLPIADRPAALDKLDQTIGRLQKEEMELLSEAQDAGINLF